MNRPAQTFEDDPRLADYRPAPGVADELFDANGIMRPVWKPFIARLLGFSPEETAERFGRGDQYLRDAGVYFRQYSNDPLQEREWPLSHIPVILHQSDWTAICAGLAQRADLLEMVMADLYGAGRLVTGGHLPAELVAANTHWLRPMVGVQPRGGHFLHFLAFELGRSPDGSWLVLGDRTQAPSGAGFALENRVATTRIFPENFSGEHIHRLASFFTAFRSAVSGLALSNGVARGAGILTPGPANDAYYEHTYIARYLGIPLLEGEDLLVQNGQAMVRTIEGPQPLGVLWRRIDSSYADPLEFNPASRIGTAGLMEAVRQGQLSMVNALGSGVLEARAMLAFLPRIAQVLTGQRLKIPNIATWWCGGAEERAYVLDNVDRMMIGPALSADLPFTINAATALGGELRRAAKLPVADWLQREARDLVGQEAVTLSTTPAWHDEDGGGQLRPSPMTIRIFAARTPSGWYFMPGGYARIGLEGDTIALSMQRGGAVADVWIVSDEPVPQPSLEARPGDAFHRSSEGTLPSRAADNLFWLGRYVERCEDAIRLIRAYHLRLAAAANPDDPLLTALADFIASIGINLDGTGPSALLHRIALAESCSAKLRDRFSTDGWLALKDLADSARSLGAAARPGDDAARAMGVLLRKMAGFSGLVHENMYRMTGWRFLSLGRALERADALALMLGTFTDEAAPPGALDLAVEVADSVMTHQRRYRVATNRDTVVDLLALDADNPRSVLFQLNQIEGLIGKLPHAQENGRPGPILRTVMPLSTELAVASPSDIPPDFLFGLRETLFSVSDQITQTYLR